jgi:hypothetical protein
MLRREEAGWSNPKVLSIIAVIFLCGVTFGSAVTSAYLHHRWLPMVASERHTMDAARNLGLQRLKAELKLDAEQTEKFGAVLDDYGKYYQNIEDEREDVAADGKRRILNILNDDQKKRFNTLLSRAR